MAQKSTKLNTNGFQMTIFFQKKAGIDWQLRALINSSNINKVSGYDNISFFFLRMEGKILAPILSLCFSYRMLLNWKYFHPFSKLQNSCQFLDLEINKH